MVFLLGRMATTTHPLEGVQAFIFDVFGTVVDWRTGVIQELQAKLGAVAPNEGTRLRALPSSSSPSLQTASGAIGARLLTEDSDWVAITEEWRKGYYRVT